MERRHLAEANKHKVIASFGEEKYDAMMSNMDDPDKIIKTHRIILPKFIRSAIAQLSPQLIS